MDYLNKFGNMLNKGVNTVKQQIQKANQLLSTADKIIISPNYDSFKIEGNTVSKVYEDKK